MGLVGAVVIAGLLSAAALVRSHPALSKSTRDPLSLDVSTTLPSLPSYSLDPDIANNLGPYSARYVVPSNVSSNVPTGCNVTMISILQRHGARYPTVNGGKELNVTLEKLQRIRNITEPSLGFVSNFTFSFIPEQLVLLGQKQSYVSGQIISKKYSALGAARFVRSAQKERILESSRWWQQGFGGGVFDVAKSSLPQPNLVANTTNNTLTIETCAAAEALDPEPGDIASQDWLQVFAPAITERLNGFLLGADLNINDTANLMSLCGYDTAAKNGTASPWCGVFTKDEWRSYEYYTDLEKYYSKSYGSAYARSQGSGWVNELLARLTGRSVQDNTTTNTTIDADPATFPIGPSAPAIFADFSSDNNIAMILSATGILRDTSDLPKTGPIPSNHQFVVSKVVPFAGSTVVEKISCPSSGAALTAGEYVRIIVNDAVVPLGFSSCGELGYSSGLCTLDGFIESQAFARAGGNFTSCFVNTSSTEVNI